MVIPLLRLLLCLIPACLSLSGAAGAEGSGTSQPPETILLPGGSITIGAHPDDPAASPDEFPRRDISVSAFHLMTHQVTRGAFAEFVRASGYSVPSGCRTLTDDGWLEDREANWAQVGFPQDDAHPVTCVSRDDALAYARWLSDTTGESFRLPSESEWAYAARGGRADYFWGDSHTVCDYGNVNDLTAKNKVAKVAEHCDDGALYTSPVATYQPNPFGLYDVIGNVWEWLADCAETDLSAVPPNGRPHQSETCERFALRGHSWTDAPGPVRLETRYALPSDARQSITGFRLARDP